MAVRIQFRRGTAAEWASANPTLAAGELGYETDTAQIKIGDGSSDWNTLAYAAVSASYVQDAIANVVGLSPSDLDTLQELANAIGDDANFVTTITDAIADAEANALAYTDNAVANLVDSAPTTLNTLNELSAALNDDENFYLTLQNSINSTNNYVVAYVDDQIQEVTDQLAVDLSSYATSADLAAAVAPLATSAELTNAVGNHEQDTTNVHGIANTADLVVSVELETSIANHAAITTNIHGIADTADLVVTANLLSEIASHNETTINVHGIADTSLLATQSFAENYADDAINQFSLVTTNVHGIANTALLATKEYSESYTNTALSSHEEDTTNVHGIANTADLVIQSDIVYLSNVTSDIQEQLDAKLATASAASIYAPIADATLTGTVSLPATTSIGDVSATEIGYLDGVTSSVQTQLDAKAPTESPTFTGAVSGITASMVGLSNVDNTSDLNKPISNATQTALDAKLSLSGGTLTGKITLDGDPTQALHATTKQYVDNVASGILAKPAVYAATTANLTATYDNGTDGVGATLTATSNGAFPVVDGVQLTTANGTRGLLVKNQSNAFENGRYNLTTLGDANTPWVLTRCGLCDTADEIPGMYVFVTDGTTNEGTGWVGYVSDPTTYEVGTDSVSFFQFAGSGAVTAGNNISVVGNQVSLVDAPTFTNTITVSSEGIEFSDGTVQTSAGVASLTGFTEKTANYTLDTLAHKDNVVEMNSSSATTFTIPTNASLAWPVGASMDIIQTGTGQVTITPASGVTLRYTPGNKLRTQWSSCTIIKRSADLWYMYGDLTA